LLVGPTNPRTTPAIYARPRLSSLGERATEEFATKTGLRSRRVLVVQCTGAYLEVHPLMYPSCSAVLGEIFEIPLGCEMKKLGDGIIDSSLDSGVTPAERDQLSDAAAVGLPGDVMLSEGRNSPRSVRLSSRSDKLEKQVSQTVPSYRTTRIPHSTSRISLQKKN
jgi:hypothetical protein